MDPGGSSSLHGKRRANTLRSFEGMTGATTSKEEGKKFLQNKTLRNEKGECLSSHNCCEPSKVLCGSFYAPYINFHSFSHHNMEERRLYLWRVQSHRRREKWERGSYSEKARGGVIPVENKSSNKKVFTIGIKAIDILIHQTWVVRQHTSLLRSIAVDSFLYFVDDALLHTQYVLKERKKRQSLLACSTKCHPEHILTVVVPWARC